ncbi:MAG: bifunctional alpha,alpha-trehalose-phosphate synthase (UDP-forming)/trehalose-phosphatase [Armatimonadota bacterium]|nr:bifunctional alpha,alpha-trehalose-phosphate synthase (UDP-forming)/trehalose-phosphatase [Armatimonadota bacterium]MDR7494554.1 bifunctional alpha,alpha-trehalose-phosphate synthase (UDP-forming)/trehalose-phosphatase [Armatimonadota bacterium]MDR7499869.1 bifunctional alpha,alpha-trehalose-phosphate synthase (UDP-forming)/trehalose-phosphatase [Armatimonadota bacterium]MDR7504479.1 bifunctional alpha,alpha-trehalose-phosphate synthase (UDP-forming)/trehalose-phosphatase [Armatimonadota bact
MDRSAVVASLRDLLGGRRLVIVSNREPYVHRRTPEGIAVERPTGGLVAALDPVLQAAGGTWVAWGSGEADFEVTDGAGRVRVPPGGGSYTLRRVALPKTEVEGYYYGYANRALWPLCHMALAHARFRRRAWKLYQSANRRFAEAVLAEAEVDSVVWIHDYHLALLPRLIRLRRPDQLLIHFWHIPWPAWDIFRACPQRTELLEGLLANDLVAFQHPRHVEHFLECVERELGAGVDRDEGVVEHGGSVTRVEAFPISVDFAALDGLARSRRAERWMARLRRQHRLEGKIVAIGVDRLDYTKGIPERLHALERLFQRFPQYRGRLVFIQKCAPSRTRIKAYRDLQRRVESEVARLNATYGTPEWQPVIYLPRPLPPAGMAALYRLADLCVVSSLQDGMNLVAKEFVACQVDGRGVLLLSELAGAREELSWALPINPYDAGGTAEMMARAATMPVEERAERMGHLRTFVAEHDIYRWMHDHLRAAAHLAARASTRSLHERGYEVRDLLRGRPGVALLIDFDGTLAPIAPAPDQVVLPEASRSALAHLARLPGVLVAVVSGRSLVDIRRRVGVTGIVYAGNHGLEMAGDDWIWTHPEARSARQRIGAVCARLQERLRAVPGVIVEDKGLSAAVHYRLTPHPYLESVRRAVYEETVRTDGVAVRDGKRVFELRPRIDWDKGTAVRWILRRVFGERWPEAVGVIYIGDDRTDEDAFLALPAPAVTVRVGLAPTATAARYALRDAGDVAQFLERLIGWLDPVPVGPPDGVGRSGA